jgi:hypothetical protein
MKGYLENQEKSKQLEQQRKNNMLEDAVKQTMNKKPNSTEIKTDSSAVHKERKILSKD